MTETSKMTDSSSVKDTAKLAGTELNRFINSTWFKGLITNDKKLETFQPISCFKGKQKINGYEAT